MDYEPEGDVLMSGANPELFIVMYCKTSLNDGVIAAKYMRAYKYINPIDGKTTTFRHFVYSYKAKRYVVADFYVCEWDGSQSKSIELPRDLWRWALRRIGLDIR